MKVTIQEFAANAEKWIRQSAAGAELTIIEDGQPIAKINPVSAPTSKSFNERRILSPEFRGLCERGKLGGTADAAHNADAGNKLSFSALRKASPEFLALYNSGKLGPGGRDVTEMISEDREDRSA